MCVTWKIKSSRKINDAIIEEMLMENSKCHKKEKISTIQLLELIVKITETQTETK